jgi:hypothetical protein
MPKSSTAKTTSLAKANSGFANAEVVQPSWDTARRLLDGIRFAIRISLAGQVCLGLELLRLKKELGFLGSGGDRRSKDHNGLLNQTWDQWCKSELGIGKTTADRFILTYEGAKAKLRRLGGEGKLLNLLETPPALMDDEARKILTEYVSKITDGASQKELLEELKLVKFHDASQIGGNTTAHKKLKPEEAAGQLAFKFFKPFVDELRGVRTDPDYERYLHVMARSHPEELIAIERDLELSLQTVRTATATINR